MIIEEIKNIKSTRKKLKEFGFVVGIFLGLLGGLLWWREKEYYVYFLLLSIILIGFAFVSPDFLKPVHKIWMTVAVLLGFIMTRVILCILFYVVLTPIGLLSKIIRKDVLDIKFDKSRNSYWNPKEKEPFNREQYEKQY